MEKTVEQAEGASYDVAVVGAGPAGLQAALTLGRMRRQVIVFGTDVYRNDPAPEMHNFIGYDGAAPAELRIAARKDVAAYPTVSFADIGVDRIDGCLDDFRLRTADGSTVRARRVVLATGVRDTLPEVPGIDELFGDVVAHCPYCHGFEFADSPIGFFDGPHASMLSEVVRRIASETITIDQGTVAGLRRGGHGVLVDLHDGSTIDLGGLFVSPTWAQAAPFAAQLGLETGELGGILVDIFQATSRPGVYAAGDLAHHRDLPMPMASVLTAAAAGLMAAAGSDRDLAMADVGHAAESPSDPGTPGSRG